MVSLLSSLLLLAPPPDTPARWAVHVEWARESSCSQSWDHTRVTASLVLELRGDGGASMCHGQHVDSVGGGWGPGRGRPTRYGRRQRQGYVGRWARAGAAGSGELELVLRPGGESCDTAETPDAERAGTRPPAPSRRSPPRPWRLRCRPLKSADGFRAPTGVPVLNCSLLGKHHGGRLGLEVVSTTGTTAILLGAGPGLLIDDVRWGGIRGELKGEPTPP